jgi:hypothetical protein
MDRERLGESFSSESGGVHPEPTGHRKIFDAEVAGLLAKASFPGHIGHIGLDAVDKVETEDPFFTIGQLHEEGIPVGPSGGNIATAGDFLKRLLRRGG